MQDGIISGNGNSRYLKTVSAALGLYPTYEDFMNALIAGTFPIDLNGINTAGWTQQGTPLNKASLLADSTATSIGLTSVATPDQAIAKIKQLIDQSNQNANTKALAELKSYIGTGTYGKSNPTSVTFSFAPDILFIPMYLENDRLISMLDYSMPTMICSILGTSFSNIINSGFSGGSNTNKEYSYGKKSSDGKTVYWYNDTDTTSQLNQDGVTYYVLAIKG